MRTTQSLPVLMYHYINRYPDSIAVSPELFEEHCNTLARNGWRGVGLAEAERYFLHAEPLPAKSCLITFDDGYLDNYVYAWPILQKYGHKGVIFAVAGRIGREETVRPTIADIWRGKADIKDLDRVDDPFIRHENGYEIRSDLFFNWAEAREMEQSGTMAVASHTYSHRGVFINNDYKGFFLPERIGRTFHTPPSFFWGLPKFVMGPGLLERAFIPSPELVTKVMDLVPQTEKEAYFFTASHDNREALKAVVAGCKNLGRLENDREMAERMRQELAKGKEVLEQGLGHEVRSLCWPWGAYSPLAQTIAREMGFSVFFSTKAGANPPGEAATIRRFKAKAKSASWLKKRVSLYSHPLLANVYALCQLRSPSKNKRKNFVIRQR